MLKIHIIIVMLLPSTIDTAIAHTTAIIKTIAADCMGLETDTVSILQDKMHEHVILRLV